MKKVLAIVLLMAIGTLCLNGAVAWDGKTVAKVGLTHSAPEQYPAKAVVQDLVRTTKRAPGERYLDLSNSSLVRNISTQLGIASSVTPFSADNLIDIRSTERGQSFSPGELAPL